MAFLFLLYSQSSPPWPPATALYRNICSHWEPLRATPQSPLLPHNTQLSPNIPIQPVCVIFRNQKPCCCNMRFWLSYRYRHHHTILIWSSSVQKYDSYKQCLLHHLPSCTKPFRGLYGEKREKEILHKIIPTGERKLLCLHSSVNDNHDSQPSLWSQPQPQLL